MHWIQVAPDKYHIRDFMDTETSLRLPQNAVILNSLETFCCLFKNGSAPWTLISVSNIYPLIICMKDPLFVLRTR